MNAGAMAREFALGRPGNKGDLTRVMRLVSSFIADLSMTRAGSPIVENAINAISPKLDSLQRIIAEELRVASK